MTDETGLYRQGTFFSQHEVVIFYQSWHPAVDGSAVLIISHGLGEHGGRYAGLAHFLAKRGIAVYACDFRGHGRSSGQRGYIRDWSDFRQDLDHLLRIARQERPGLPLFLFGHSLGGLITLDYILEQSQDFQGVVLSGTAVAETAIPATRKLLIKLLSRVWPSFSTTSGLDANGISSQPDEVRSYQTDALVHDLGTPRLGSEVSRIQGEVLLIIDQLTLPVLLLHGEKDPLIPPTISLLIYDKIPHPDKKLIYYPGCLHEVHHDVLRDQEFSDIATWLLARS